MQVLPSFNCMVGNPRPIRRFTAALGQDSANPPPMQVFPPNWDSLKLHPRGLCLICWMQCRRSLLCATKALHAAAALAYLLHLYSKITSSPTKFRNFYVKIRCHSICFGSEHSTLFRGKTSIHNSALHIYALRRLT